MSAVQAKEMTKEKAQEKKQEKMQVPVCEIRNVCTQYGNLVIHKNLNLKIMQGELVALVGGSGSGKTTLLRHIVGLTTPTSGEVLLFGHDLHKMDRV
ncbi:MAG TPA: ATP-binding cassette domain-containing protein, partial [Methylophilaceae bacterium]|nr:ATP-binding cassette domain-containing protein [Methylophilaceae bacterium]